MNSILVTGGAGFIGSFTVELLLAKGYKIAILDNFKYGSIKNIEHLHGKVDVVKCDVRNYDELTHIIQKVDAVIHLAAIVSVDEVNENPLKAFEVNAIGTLNLLELARKYDLERFVYASSTAVYGEPRYLPVDENHIVSPLNPYGASKLAGEALVNSYRETYGLSTISLRYFNVYGPRMRPGPYAGVIMKFVQAALKNEPLVIFGDGTQTRDFVFVKDVARANTIALESKETGIFNVGTGKETSINELAEIIIKLTKSKSKIIHTYPRPGDIRRSVADISKIRNKLKWTPEIDLLRGLKETIRYLSQTL